VKCWLAYCSVFCWLALSSKQSSSALDSALKPPRWGAMGAAGTRPACLPASIPQPKPAPRIKPALGVGPRHTGRSPPSGPTGIKQGPGAPSDPLGLALPGAKNEYEGYAALAGEGYSGDPAEYPTHARIHAYVRTCLRFCLGNLGPVCCGSNVAAGFRKLSRLSGIECLAEMMHSVGSVIKAKFAKLANHGSFEEIHVWATSWASNSVAAESLEQKLNGQN
jgi:hypothetical protein